MTRFFHPFPLGRKGVEGKVGSPKTEFFKLKSRP